MASNRQNKGSVAFEDTIREYLEKRAENDALFAVKFSNPSKSVEDCVTYIINEVQKSGCNGFADDEIFGMAIHYYEENEIEVGKPINCQMVVNHTVELTEEEKEQARLLTPHCYETQDQDTERGCKTISNSAQTYSGSN